MNDYFFGDHTQTSSRLYRDLDKMAAELKMGVAGAGTWSPHDVGDQWKIGLVGPRRLIIRILIGFLDFWIFFDF